MTRTHRAYTGGEAMGEDTFLFFRALGIESAPVLRPDRNGGAHRRAAGRAGDAARRRQADAGCRRADRRQRRNCRALRLGDRRLFRRSGSHRARRSIDGWLHTGDAGYLEPSGQLVVLGRVSEVVRTARRRTLHSRTTSRTGSSSVRMSATSRCSAPAATSSPPSCASILRPRAIGRRSAASRSRPTPICRKSRTSPSSSPPFSRHVNESLPQPLRLRRFVNLHKDFDPDDGEITRTRKLRRNVIEERYQAADRPRSIRAPASVVENTRITYESGQTGTISRTLSICEVP